MLIELDPEVAKIFHQSQSVSVSKGNSAHLMKISAKRRRTKQEILEEKQQLLAEKEQLQREHQELLALREKFTELERRVELAAMVEKQCAGWADEGKIKLVADGQNEIVDDPDERQHIMDTRRKEKQEEQQIQEVQGENLMDRFNAEDEDEEFG